MKFPSLGNVGEHDVAPRMVVEVDRGRVVLCIELSGGSEDGIVECEQVSKEGWCEICVDTVDGRLLPEEEERF